MKQNITLSPAYPAQTINLTWQAAAICVANPTASPIYVRMGSNDYADSTNADIVVPAGTAQSYPASSNMFSVIFADSTTIQSASSAQSGLFSIAEVTVLSVDEKVPTYGSYSFLSLSISDLTKGEIPFSPTPTVFDIGAWGGVLLYLYPATGSGQGLLQIDVSSNNSTYTPLGLFSFWPNVPAILTVPRPVRYVKVTFLATGISGEPAISGTWSARGSLVEITALTYNPIATSISKAYSLAAIGSVSYVFATAGLSAITAGINNATGTEGEMVVYAGATAAGPWRLVNFREQNLQGFYNSIYRSIGNLNLFTRIDIFELANVAMTGTLNMLINPSPDLTSILQSVYAALGDVGQPVNTNQSIYHELDTIRQLQTTGNATLVSANSHLNQIQTLNTQLVGFITTQNVPSVGSFFVASAGVWQNAGPVFSAGQYVQALQVSFEAAASVTPATILSLGIGTTSAIQFVLYQVIKANQIPTQPFDCIGPTLRLDSFRGGGFIVPATWTTLWIQSSAIVGTMVTTILVG